MRITTTVAALLCAGAPLLAPAAAGAATAGSETTADLPAWEPVDVAGVQEGQAAQADAELPTVFTVSTSGDPEHATLLNAATMAGVIAKAYRTTGVEVAGVQVAGDPDGPVFTVSTSGSPDLAALLNAATILQGAYQGGQSR